MSRELRKQYPKITGVKGDTPLKDLSSVLKLLRGSVNSQILGISPHAIPEKDRGVGAS